MGYLTPKEQAHQRAAATAFLADPNAATAAAAGVASNWDVLSDAQKQTIISNVTGAVATGSLGSMSFGGDVSANPEATTFGWPVLIIGALALFFLLRK